MGEAAWLASFAAYKAGRMDQAVAWARISVAMGCYRGFGNDLPRRGFREPRGLYEGPFDVLRFALRQTGDEAGADDAERHMHLAVTARETRDQSYRVQGRVLP
jgi:hypothetical protein